MAVNSAASSDTPGSPSFQSDETWLFFLALFWLGRALWVIQASEF